MRLNHPGKRLIVSIYRNMAMIYYKMYRNVLVSVEGSYSLYGNPLNGVNNSVDKAGQGNWCVHEDYQSTHI